MSADTAEPKGYGKVLFRPYIGIGIVKYVPLRAACGVEDFDIKFRREFEYTVHWQHVVLRFDRDSGRVDWPGRVGLVFPWSIFVNLVYSVSQ